MRLKLKVRWPYWTKTQGKGDRCSNSIWDWESAQTSGANLWFREECQELEGLLSNVSNLLFEISLLRSFNVNIWLSIFLNQQ